MYMILQEQLSFKYKCRYKTLRMIFKNQKKSNARNVNTKIDFVLLILYFIVYIIFISFTYVYVFYIISNPDIMAYILK